MTRNNVKKELHKHIILLTMIVSIKILLELTVSRINFKLLVS